MEFEVNSESEFRSAVLRALSGLPDRAVLLLEGDLGAGKTLAVRTLAEHWGAMEVSSPSYAVIQKYSTLRAPIYHVDLYRLRDADDLESTGFWDLFLEPKGLICIEWADRLDASRLPRSWPVWRLRIEKIGPGSRRLEITNPK